MSLPEEIAGVAVVERRRAGGGDINEAYACELADGRRAFVKTRPDPPPGEYAAEAAALRWLGEPGTVRVPEVLEAADGFLALAWIEPGALSPQGWEDLGGGLAGMHAAGAAAFGVGSGRLGIGPLAFDASPSHDWPAFYAERLLAPLVRRARDRGSLGPGGVEAVLRVCERIADLAGPPEPPARLHGDLWSGNVMGGADGRAWLVDPAAYGGHREVDLAMLRLFGSPPRRFWAAYEAVAPLAAGHEERVELWQLFPLLVHAVLFGAVYGGSAERAARRYVG